jgi:hypothetical protein
LRELRNSLRNSRAQSGRGPVIRGQVRGIPRVCVLAQTGSTLASYLPDVAHSQDDWLAPMAVGDDLDCNAPESDEPRDEQAVLEELITEMRCLDEGLTAGTQGWAPPPDRCFPPRCCVTVPTDPD